MSPAEAAVFIRTWNAASSMAEVVSTLGIDARAASWRAWSLRQGGRSLKKFLERAPQEDARCTDCPTPVKTPRVRCGPCAIAWLARTDADFARGVDELGRLRHMEDGA